MKTQNTKPQATKLTEIKDLDPRDQRGVKAGLSLNFTKVEYKFVEYDSQHKP